MPLAAFETTRLIARRWKGAELSDLLAVYADAQAMRWVGDGLALTAAQCEQWIAVTLDNYRKRGYGMLALEEKASPGRPVIGFAGLVHPGGQAEPELKYAFRRSHWGQGFASEAVRGLVHYAHSALGLDELLATAAAENVASHKVLLKSGFVRGPLRHEEDGSHTQLFMWRANEKGAAGPL